MVDNQILDNVKVLIGAKDSPYLDDILNLYIEMAEEEITEFCGAGVNIPPSLVTQIVVIKYQRRGTESLSNSNYSGNGETYLNGYPPYILTRLEELKKSNRRLRTL